MIRLRIIEEKGRSHAFSSATLEILTYMCSTLLSTVGIFRCCESTCAVVATDLERTGEEQTTRVIVTSPVSALFA